jgi:hypothetical protein
MRAFLQHKPNPWGRNEYYELGNAQLDSFHCAAQRSRGRVEHNCYDWGGWGYEALNQTEVAAILEEFPRLEMKKQFARAVCRNLETRPDTTYDNFARDFGERFVRGYKPMSTVDYLLNSPFKG